jgi:hypothetical protein
VEELVMRISSLADLGIVDAKAASER